MGRKGNWFSSVRKALSPESTEKKHQKSKKSKKKWFGKKRYPAPDSPLPIGTVEVSHHPPPEEVNWTEVDNEQTKHAYSVAVATDVAAESAAVAAARATAEVVRVTIPARFAGKSKEEVAAIRIQTAFRGYLARTALRALRGLVRLKSLVEGPTITRQTTNTLRCMQTLARVHSQIHSRRLRMSEENQALQKQLLQKRAKELESLQMGENWDDSLQSKQQIEASLLSKYEAATRRERAMAYSFSHQQTWKKSTRSANLLFMDPNNPQWGWSWIERWMAARPWDNRSTSEKEPTNDHSSVKSTASLIIPGGEITKSYVRHQLNSEKTPSTPTAKSATSTIARKVKPASSPRGSPLSRDDDAKSIFSVQSEKNRRHSTGGGGPGPRDDESMAGSPAVPSYMASTKSAKAKLRMQSPLGLDNNGTPPEKELPIGSAKKRLSFPPSSPAMLPPRRHSGPPKVDIGSVVEISVENGGNN